MRQLPTLGLVLIVLGALALILQLAGVFTQTIIDVGPLQVEQERQLPWLPWVAGGAIVMGIVLMAGGRRA